MKNILICFGCTFLLSACTFDILGTPDSSSYLRNKEGEAFMIVLGGGFKKLG